MSGTQIQTHRLNGDGELVPPRDHSAEAVVIACLLHNNALFADVRTKVSASDFSHPLYRLAFGAIERRAATGGTFSVDTLIQQLELDGLLDEAGELDVRSLPDAVYPFDTGRGVDAARNVAEFAARRRLIDRCRGAMVAAHNPAEPLEDIRRRLAQDDQRGGVERFKLYSAAELDAAEFDESYLVKDIAVAGQLGVIGGLYKSLKTSTACDLALSAATGLRFLNHFETHEAISTGLFAGEGGGKVTRSILRRVAKSKGGSLSDVRNLHVCNEVPRLDSPAMVAELKGHIVKHSMRLAVLDPFYRMGAGAADRAGNVYAMGELLWTLVELTQQTGCAIFVCHHCSRRNANNGEPADLTDLTQAGVAEAVGQWLLLARRSTFDPDTGRHELWMTSGGRSGHSGLFAVDITEGLESDLDGRIWQPEVRPAGEARRDAKQAAQQAREAERDAKREAAASEDRKRIIRAMVKFPDGETKSLLRDVAGVDSRRFGPIFAELLSTGEVEACEVTKGNGRKYDGFRLTKDSLG